MDQLDLREAQLYRILGNLFGKENVIIGMSVLAICGGTFPENMALTNQDINLKEWAKNNSCLFTIMDSQDNPKMVVQLQADFSQEIDIQILESREYAAPILKSAGIRYVTFTRNELAGVLDPQGKLDITALLLLKLEA